MLPEIAQAPRPLVIEESSIFCAVMKEGRSGMNVIFLPAKVKV